MVGGNGIEGITFAPDPNHPEGGTFFVTKQSFGLEDREDPSAIFEVEASIKSNKSNEAEIVRCFYPRVVDLVDISYDYSSGNFYVISDENNVLFEMTREGKILQTYDLPGKDQQGIAFDNEGFVYIAQDSGGIIRYKWNKSQGVMDLD